MCSISFLFIDHFFSNFKPFSSFVSFSSDLWPAKSYEVNYEPVFLRDWMAANPMVPIAAVLLYGVFIVLGRSYFQSRPAWNWRTSMALWNLGLSVFSAVGFCRVAPQLIHDFYYYSVTENFCFDPESFYGSGATGLWVQLFVLSKFPYVSFGFVV
jgi:hypothetical protein